MALAFGIASSNSGNTALGTSYSATAQTVAANSVIFCQVWNTKGSTPDTPTVSGGSLTWTNIYNVTDSAGIRHSIWRAFASASVSVTANASFGANQTGCIIQWYSFTGAKTTGTNAADAIKQSNSASAASTGVTVTLSAGTAGNYTLHFAGTSRNQAMTGDGGSWSLTYTSNYGSPAACAMLEYLAGNDTSMYATASSLSDNYYAFALELAAAAAPTVTTSAASSITGTTATGNGNVTADNGRTITERGFCWSTSINPTTSNSKVAVAGTTGSYSGSMTGLTPGTLYHYRAYAINNIGTSYGADTTFTTTSGSGFFLLMK